MKVEKVIIGKQGEVSEQYKQFNKIINEKNIPVVIVKKGDIVNILNSKKNENTTWYLCLGNGDKFGWVSGDYISPV